MHYIYKITNLVNSKLYIGQTNNPPLRWSQHKSNAKYDKGNQIITRALTKYGPNSFIFEIIATCLTQSDADATEEQLIQQYDSISMQKGYNVSAGGNTSPRTQDILDKISSSLKEFYKTHDSHLKGKNLTAEWKKKISESHIGLPGTNNGKKFPDEWKKKISKSQSGKDRKSRRRFSEEIEKEICRLYAEENKSTYRLGKDFDCNRNFIISILNRNGVHMRKNNYTHSFDNLKKFSLEQELEICDLYSNHNYTREVLSEQFNCGKTTIRSILLRHNVKL